MLTSTSSILIAVAILVAIVLLSKIIKSVFKLVVIGAIAYFVFGMTVINSAITNSYEFFKGRIPDWANADNIISAIIEMIKGAVGL
jgi:uncharacterized membrane protein (UPF0182 family)